jgi:hypothetical protein
MGAMPPSDEQPAGPAPLASGEVARYVVAAAVWAPSVHNTQPWRFTAAGQQISVYADAGRQLMAADPDGREMMISCGAALFTERLALRSLGYLPQASVLPDPGQPLPVARLSWGGRAECTGFEQALFGQVRQRRTHCGGFDLFHCRRACWPPSARAPLIMVGCCGSSATMGGGPRSPRPLPKRNGRNGSTASASGNWPGGHRRRAAQRPMVCRRPPTRRGPSTRTRTSLGGISPPAAAGACRRSAPRRGPGPPGSPPCSPPSMTARWTGSTPGRALQRILLAASTFGAAVALHTQPLELGWLRESIRTGLSDGAYPQLVPRFGAVVQAAVSVRRPLEDTLPADGSDNVGVRDG